MITTIIKRSIHLFSLALPLFLSITTAAQQDVANDLKKEFDNYRKSNLQEKLYVHTDKNVYLAGEILWFKLYDVDASFHKALSVSSVAYVEILDNSNNAVLQAKVALLNKGLGNGSITMPVTTRSGNYKLRAYTTWMKNFSPEFFFEKTITIINSQQATDLPDQPIKARYDVQFFPEGGDLVNAVDSKIAFKAIDKDGIGVACSGEIKDDKGNTVTSFYTFKFGMGNFLLKPEEGRSYTAYVHMPDGSVASKPLPAALSSGYTMSVKAEDGFKVTVKAKTGANTAPMVYLFVHTRQSVKAALTGTIQNGEANFILNKDVPGEGISHLTVFNSDRQPVCERLIFRYPDTLNISIAADQSTYATRKKINVDVTSSFKGKGIAANMSMAVYKLDSLQISEATGITDYIWLTSDLQGNIESPSFYFDQSNDTAAQALDNLLLTQGWRRFKWQDVLENKKPAFVYMPEINGHIVNGKILNNKTGQPTGGITAYLTVPGIRPQFKSAVSDSTGDIKFEVKEFYGAGSIIVQTGPADSNYHVDIATPFSVQYASHSLPAYTRPAKSPETLLENSIASQVQNIYTAGQFNNYLLTSDSMPFYYHASQTYLLDNYTRFTTIEEIFREYVPFVNVRRRNGVYHLPLYNDVNAVLNEGSFEEDPLILLDGLPVFDMNKFMNYDPLKIRRVDLVTRKYFYGNSVFNGIINFTTYKGDLNSYELDPQTVVLDYDALQLEKEFYSPVYETELQYTSHKPDFRTLLQWSPDINTDPVGKARVSFYSSDQVGKYMGIIQGISNGKTGSAKVFFDVK